MKHASSAGRFSACLGKNRFLFLGRLLAFCKFHFQQRYTETSRRMGLIVSWKLTISCVLIWSFSFFCGYGNTATAYLFMVLQMINGYDETWCGNFVWVSDWKENEIDVFSQEIGNLSCLRRYLIFTNAYAWLKKYNYSLHNIFNSAL